MTNREYLTATLTRFGATESDVDLVLINQGLEAGDDVDISVVKLAMYSEFATIIPLADISEGGYSVKWNMSAVKLWYAQLARDLGMENTLEAPAEDEINDASWRW